MTSQLTRRLFQPKIIAFDIVWFRCDWWVKMFCPETKLSINFNLNTVILTFGLLFQKLNMDLVLFFFRTNATVGHVNIFKIQFMKCFCDLVFWTIGLRVNLNLFVIFVQHFKLCISTLTLTVDLLIKLSTWEL